MVYFLINNNYHLYDLRLLLKDKDFECSLIRVPHTLSELEEDRSFKDIYTFNFFYKGFLSLFNFPVFNKIHKLINSQLELNDNDVLFVYSDYEILNQYIIRKFKRSGGRVYILEDGLASALVYNLDKKSLPLKNFISLALIRYFVGYKYTDLVFENKNFYPVIQDRYIDGICFYLETKIKKDIPVMYLRNNTVAISNLKNDIAIFLNQDTYLFDQTETTYFEDLKVIFDGTHENFSILYFKFHPRETQEKRDEIKECLKSYSNIQFIEEKIAIEDIISKYSPKYAISYYSSSLKNLFFLGVEPVFIYHLLPSIAENEFSIILNQYLNNLDYNFVKSFEEISPAYSSGLKMPEVTFSITDILLD